MKASIIFTLLFIPYLIAAQDFSHKVKTNYAIKHVGDFSSSKMFEEAESSSIDIRLREIDEFTGNTRISTKAIMIGKNKNGGKLFMDSFYLKTDQIDRYYFYISIDSDLGCLSEHKTYAMLKSGSTIISIPQVGDTDCNPEPFASFLPIEAEGKDDMNRRYTSDDEWDESYNEVMKLIKTQPIEKIRLYGSKYFSDYTIDDPMVMSKMILAIEEAKYH